MWYCRLTYNWCEGQIGGMEATFEGVTGLLINIGWIYTCELLETYLYVTVLSLEEEKSQRIEVMSDNLRNGF
jgi:hypothetical protein